MKQMQRQDKTFDKWQKRRKMCCMLEREAITQQKERPSSVSGYSSSSTAAFLLFPHLWRRAESQALWPLTLCVRRETCVSLWLPLWQTEECMSFTVLENRLRQPQKKAHSIHIFIPSLLLSLPAHLCCSACYKKISHWKTLRSKLFE